MGIKHIFSFYKQGVALIENEISKTRYGNIFRYF